MMLQKTTTATALALTMLIACGGDDGTVVEVSQDRAELSTLVDLLTTAGLVDTLNGDGPFTIFAPTNAAFDKIPAATLSALRADPAALADVLKLRVVSGEVNAEAVTALSSATTLNGMVSIRVDGGSVIITDPNGGESTVTETDIEASNGIIHLLDSVLLPMEEVEGPGNIVEVATAAGFSTLVSAATDAGLAGALTGPGPLTVFAPTNEAFEALGGAVPSDPGLLANVLLAHVVAGELDSAAVTANGPFTSLANISLTVDTAASPITMNGFNLSSTLDVEASNGIIHVMDQVIVPPTILDVAAATEDLSTLVTAVGAASSAVSDALASGPITVFAPVNSAFAAIDADDLNALLADQPQLDKVLSYHVATSQAVSSDLSDGQVITMASGDALTVNISGSNVTLTDLAGNTVNVVTADIRLLNGTVHLIDGVLIPEAAPQVGNIVEVASDNGSFGTLLGAAVATGLDAALAGPGPLTVFAPTDAAFTALGVDLGPVSADVISNILLYHVVGGSFDSAAVVGASDLASLANLPLAIDAGGSPITIGGANLSETLDVEASNGIIHVMDQVIVPPTIIDVAAATPALSVLVQAVGAASAGVQGALAPNTLGGDSPITVFAPTNDAFVASGIDLGSVPQSALDAVLAHHAVGIQATSDGLTDGQTVPTLNGDITINVAGDGSISVTDGMGNTANVIATLKDIRTLTGVVHVIDAVLMPSN